MKSRLILALIVATAASGAAAQKMYKSTMPDGSVVYSEKPTPNAKKVDEVTPPPPTSGLSTITPQEKARADSLSRQRAGEKAAPNELENARKQLQQAEAARKAGDEPREGERLGTAKGGSRLTDDYHARLKGLDAAVETARKRVQQLEKR